MLATLLSLLVLAPVQPAPLRHVVYDVTIDITSASSAQTLTCGGCGDEVGLAPIGISHGKRDRAAGTITVDVLQALGDGSLVARISENAQDRATPPITLGITGDGWLMLDGPGASAILPEEVGIARLMARHIVAGHEVVAGSTWHVERHDVTDEELHLRVVSAGAGKALHIVMDGSDSSKQADGMHDRYTVDMSYDSQKTIPTDATIRSSVLELTGTARTQMQMLVRYNLAADSMSSR